MDFRKIKYNLSSNTSGSLDRIKLKLGLEDDAQDDLLSIFIDDASKLICLYISTETLPVNLNFIAEEIAIKRFRKIGSEGLTSESIDVIQSSFESDTLTEYKPLLDEYKKSQSRRLRTL
jgi:hypothetical protein|nr:MAG TPA: PORTAL PROTEIN, 15 PROTEIN, HEAD PROTEIN, VIRAL INFECTION, TAILED.2A [Caudoviricetes sp.]